MKLRGDWIVDEETVAEPRLLPAGVLAAAVRRVHEAGGRVAIHAMHEVACRRAVEAGVDSLEHGLWLARDLLPRMAAQGTRTAISHRLPRAARQRARIFMHSQRWA